MPTDPTAIRVVTYLAEHGETPLETLNVAFGYRDFEPFETALNDVLDSLIRQGKVTEDWPKGSRCTTYRLAAPKGQVWGA